MATFGTREFGRNVLITTVAAFALASAAAWGTIALLRHFAHPSPPSVDHGAAIYLKNCASCHGASLEGQPDWRHLNAAGRLPAPPLNGTGHAWRHSDAELFHLIKFSVLDQAGPGYQTDMPAWDGKLSDDDIRAVVVFVKSTWPAGVQAAQSFLNPGHAGMPAHVEGDWRLPPDCEEPDRGKKKAAP